MAKRECMNVKIEADLVLKAKVVAAARRITLTDYISDLVRERIHGDLALVAAGLASDDEIAESQTPAIICTRKPRSNFDTPILR